jgi:SAM-dependent methyltransferase
MTLHAMDVVESPVLNRSISPDDVMFESDPHRYFHLGAEAFRCIETIRAAVGVPTPGRILDLPSGHGRVLRVLRVAFPQAEVVACDLDRGAVDFCAGELGAIPCYSDRDPSHIRLEGSFDLIWCGSLFTHLDQPRWSEFLELFDSVLAPSGVLVFTTHGPYLVDEVRRGARDFPVASTSDLVARFDLDGFGYQDYTGQLGYGISLSSPEWVIRLLRQRAGLSLAAYLARGWAGRQDAFACVRGERA